VFSGWPQVRAEYQKAGSLKVPPVPGVEKLGPWYHAALGSGLDAMKHKFCQKTGNRIFNGKPTALA